jgi:hypothetical protein
VITVEDYPRALRLGTRGRVLLGVEGRVPVRRLDLDLLGDGVDAQRLVGEDLRDVGGIWLRPSQAGEYQLQIRAEDACGRLDQTGASRPVKVTR